MLIIQYTKLITQYSKKTQYSLLKKYSILKNTQYSLLYTQSTQLNQIHVNIQIHWIQYTNTQSNTYTHYSKNTLLITQCSLFI